MGEVYRARDHRLARDVALKILPELFAADPERLARFEREAQVLAALNHPHIAQIHGLEESAPAGGPRVRALVMELVEGDDLADRLAPGALTVDEAVGIARQIADALEAAHEQGIVHRDLKPANIKVRADGTVKVLDFGLAKALDPSAGSRDGSPASAANSPTITTPAMTHAGVVLGTAAYMSPEQARGKAVDRRADIWAFGCVLYEMLTGHRAFAGDTVTDTIAAIVTREPDWSALPTTTPPHVRALLARCLAKDARRRLRDIGDARLDLEEPRTPLAGVGGSTAASPRWRRAAPWMIALAAVAVAIIASLRFVSSPPPVVDSFPTHLSILPPEGTMLDLPGTIRSAGVVGISPDGRHLSLLAATPTGRLWVRRLDSLTPRLLPKTEGALQPFWSADSQSIGFFAQSQLRRVDLATGVVQALAPVTDTRGGAWNADGIILFNGSGSSGLSRVSAAGGPVGRATALDAARGDRRHQWPSFLPDGRRFLFLNVTDQPASGGICLGSLDNTDTTFIVRSRSNAAYANGYLLYERDGVLLAHRFDLERGIVIGEPAVVTQPVVYSAVARHVTFSVSTTGVLAYASGESGDARLGWFNRTGQKTGTLDAITHLDISLDGSQVAADRTDPQNGNRDVWVFDLRRGTRTRLTFSPAQDWVPQWSPDGTRVAYTSDRDSLGVAQIYLKAAGGGGADELLLKTDANKHHMHWSRDGRFLMFESADKAGGHDLWVLPMSGPRQPQPYLQTPFNEAQPMFSPDVRYVAYVSNESGPFEVYVQTFPATGGRWQISTGGGIQPRWRQDGKELYYLAADGKLMTLDVDLQGPTFGVPRMLFQTTILGEATTEHFSVTSDGQRFLLMDSSQTRSSLSVLVNWPSLLKR